MARPFVLTGGGTGGHLFPMRAVAEALHDAGVAWGDLRVVGSARGQDAAVLGGSPVALTLLPGRGLRRSWSPSALAANAAAVAGLAAALARALALVARWRPAAVVSFGGYASLPTALAAVLWRRPLVLVDLDEAPSAAHRLLARAAAARCAAAPEPGADLTGAPVRAEVLAVDRSPDARGAARAALAPPLGPGRGVVVVMTGSLGSARVNGAVSDLAARWAGRADRAIVHVTGRRDHAAVRAAAPATTGLDYRVLDFADMTTWWAVADAAVCRAGASTLAELTALGLPAVLVPLPGAPGDHQARNAATLAAAGAATVIEDGACTGATLAAALDALLDPPRLAAAAAAAAGLGRRDAAARVAAVAVREARP